MVNILEIYGGKLLYRIVLPYACYGVVVDNRGIVINAPPIARGFMRQDISVLSNFVRSRCGSIDIIPDMGVISI